MWQSPPIRFYAISSVKLDLGILKGIFWEFHYTLKCILEPTTLLFTAPKSDGMKSQGYIKTSQREFFIITSHDYLKFRPSVRPPPRPLTPQKCQIVIMFIKETSLEICLIFVAWAKLWQCSVTAEDKYCPTGAQLLSQHHHHYYNHHIMIIIIFSLCLCLSLSLLKLSEFAKWHKMANPICSPPSLLPKCLLTFPETTLPYIFNIVEYTWPHKPITFWSIT